jgi:hypothetical protein
VQAALSHGWQIRTVGFPCLLIATVPDREQVTVLPYDSDYELIAKVTGQPVQWIVTTFYGRIRAAHLRSGRPAGQGPPGQI